jgi:excisionase family DNA binding protein
MQKQPMKKTEVAVDLALRKALKVREAAALLGISPKSIRRLIARKLLRANSSLRTPLIPADELTRFLNQG